jgi:hypothetical protein
MTAAAPEAHGRASAQFRAVKVASNATLRLATGTIVSIRTNAVIVILHRAAVNRAMTARPRADHDIAHHHHPNGDLHNTETTEEIETETVIEGVNMVNTVEIDTGTINKVVGRFMTLGKAAIEIVSSLEPARTNHAMDETVAVRSQFHHPGESQHPSPDPRGSGA